MSICRNRSFIGLRGILQGSINSYFPFFWVNIFGFFVKIKWNEKHAPHFSLIRDILPWILFASFLTCSTHLRWLWDPCCNPERSIVPGPDIEPILYIPRFANLKVFRRGNVFCGTHFTGYWSSLEALKTEISEFVLKSFNEEIFLSLNSSSIAFRQRAGFSNNFHTRCRFHHFVILWISWVRMKIEFLPHTGQSPFYGAKNILSGKM